MLPSHPTLATPLFGSKQSAPGAAHSPLIWSMSTVCFDNDE